MYSIYHNLDMERQEGVGGVCEMLPKGPPSVTSSSPPAAAQAAGVSF